MTSFDLLQTIATLALTLVGFVGIVVTAGRLARPNQRPIDRLLFFSMIGPSLTILACVFIPELANSLGASPIIGWRVGNGLLGLLHLANLLPVLFTLGRLKFNWLQMSFMASGIAAIVAHGLAASALIPWAQFVFLIGLLQQLSVAIYMFLELVQSERGDARA